MLSFNKKATVSFAYIGSLLSLAALLIFTILPTSELANGIQYSAKDALWVLILAPVLALFGAVNFMYAFLKDYKIWQNVLSKPIVLGATVVLGALFVFNFAVYLSYTVSQFDLGFVAPYTGTIYDTLETLLIVFTLHQFIFSAFATALAIKK